ncbi:MAG: hypothetical protein WDN75_19010 [Bacteroidota bacterium]
MSITSFSQFRNTKLAEEAEGYPAFNPGVAINHKDTKNIVVGASLNRSFSTNDGGATWNESVLTSPDGGGNPVVVSDQKGQMFYFHKTDPGGKGNGSDAWLDHIICQKSGGRRQDLGCGRFLWQQSSKRSGPLFSSGESQKISVVHDVDTI